MIECERKPILLGSATVNESEVIIQLGAEGGSITLFGFQTERGWSFWREVTDSTLDEERTQHKSAVVDTWEAALKLLDRYPWCRLSPIRIHPEFKQKIWVALQGRLHVATGISQRELERWRKLCGADRYLTGLERNFSKFRDDRFAGSEDVFEIRRGGAVVFKPECVKKNLPISPKWSVNDGDCIIGKLRPSKRHKHFGSMRSSQALAQSVFGAIEVFHLLRLLSDIESEDGRCAFGPRVGEAKLEFEKEMQNLGEERRRTSIECGSKVPVR
jgi:hypothetical protein